MPTVRVGGFSRIGQVSDSPPFDLNPGAFTRTLNVVCDDGAVRKMQGMTSRYDLDNAATNPDGHPGAVAPAGLPIWFENWFMNDTGQMMVLSEDSPGVAGSGRFFLLDGAGVFNEVTGAASSSDAKLWDSSTFGEFLIWTNKDTQPYLYGPQTAGDLEVMPGWPDNDPGFPEVWTAEIIRPYGNFLIAMKMIKDGVVLKDRIQWSDAADATGLPPNWNETDPTSLAGGGYIRGDTGDIIEGRQLGDNFIIYTQRSIWSLSLVGGGYTMHLRKLAERGLLNRRCVVEIDNFHFCVGPGAFYVFDGTNVRLVGEERITRTFFDKAVRTDNIHVSHNPLDKKVYVFYQGDRSDDYATFGVIWDYRDDVWTEMLYTPTFVCRAQYGPTSGKAETWATITGQWNDIAYNWSNLEATQGDLKFHMLARDNNIYELGGTYLRNGEFYRAVVERLYVDCDDLLGDQGGLRTQAIKHIKRIYPQIEGSGVVNFQFGQAMEPGGTIRWNDPVSFEIGQDYKVDTRLSGRYMCWRVRSRNNGSWALTGFDLTVELSGER